MTNYIYIVNIILYMIKLYYLLLIIFFNFNFLNLTNMNKIYYNKNNLKKYIYN